MTKYVEIIFQFKHSGRVSVRALITLLAFIVLGLKASAQQDELVVSGYAAVQTMDDNEHKPAKDVTIRIYDDDGVSLAESTGVSGSFYFRLPVGTDYLVEWVKEGYTSKRMLFDLIAVSDGDIRKSNLKFEFDMTLVETTFLTKELMSEAQVTRVWWSEDDGEFLYSGAVDNYWEKFDELQTKYELAVKDAKSERVGKLIYQVEENIVWPEDPGDSVNIVVLDDYSTFVQLKMLQQKDPGKKASSVGLAEGVEDLKKIQQKSKANVVFATQESGVSGKELKELAGESGLVITEGYGMNESMVNLESSLYETKYSLNDIELVKKGFATTAELREDAVMTSDKSEWSAVIADAQQTLKTEKERSKEIERQKNSLALMNKGLSKSKTELDSALKFKSYEVNMLESNIKSKGQQLSNLNSLMGKRNRELAEAQKLFEQRQSELENTAQELKSKEHKLLEFDQLLASTAAEAERQKANLTEYVQLLDDQKKLNGAIAGVLGLISLLFFFAYRNYRKQKRLAVENAKQAQAIEAQRSQLDEKNTELNDSITYAQRIQNAMLPGMTELSAAVKDSFIIYEPKDVVAGDFFWIQKSGDVVYFAVADCTGHGVPGAMMSVVCYNALDRALRELGTVGPAGILDRTRDFVIEQITNTGEVVKDGMDIALCSWNEKTKELQFAGAQNPLWLVTKREIDDLNKATLKEENLDVTAYEIKGDKQPIGVFEYAKPFVNHTLKLEEGDAIYIFSDGFPDQFGGQNGKKMKYRLFRELLVMSGNGKMDVQKEFLSEYFLNWRGELEQIDDVCVMGVRV